MKKMALLLPGIGYTHDRPLLHFGRRLLQSMGYEVQRVDYRLTPDRSLANEERLTLCCEQALSKAQAQMADIDLKDWGEVVLVGKSIGTAVAAGLATQWELSTKLVLFTPLKQTFRWPIWDAVVFTGTADPWVKEGEIPLLCRERGIDCKVIPEANHSLETGDVYRDLEILRRCMKDVEVFLS